MTRPAPALSAREPADRPLAAARALVAGRWSLATSGSLRGGVLLAALCSSLLLAPLAGAQPNTIPGAATVSGSTLKSANDPLPDFPPGSIRTEEQSHAAEKAAIEAAKNQVKRFEAQRQACFKKFLAENCLSAARSEDYQIRRRISALELEARNFRRQASSKGAEERRAQADAKRRASEGVDGAERDRKIADQEKRVQRNQREQEEFDAKAGERAGTAAAIKKRENDRIAERQRKEAEDKAMAPERAERARQRQAEVDEVLKKAAEREAQQKEKERVKAERAKQG